MTTWATVELSSTDFVDAADNFNGYVVGGYVANRYLNGAVVWAAVDATDTTWS
jgi:hypothetical protein